MTLSAGAVARQLGISPATLRTWARRYGLEPSARSEGSHRRYSPEDVDRLVAMQRLMRSGMPVADAAGQVLASAPEPTRFVEGTGGECGSGAVRSLWMAAKALDGQRCAHIVADNVSRYGVVSTWGDLVVPVLQRAGAQWEEKHLGVEVEHVLSDAVTAGLFLDTHVKREGVLLAATATEDHVLPLYALRAALAEHGIGVELLTARTPATALADATRRLRPSVIILWSHIPENADESGFAELPALRPRPALAVAGPGWSHWDRPAPHLTGLSEAVNFVRSHL